MISVIIPCRMTDRPYLALRTLAVQEPPREPMEFIVSWDHEQRGANWARNRGFEKSRGDFLLFSDNDIAWYPDAILGLRRALYSTPAAAYSYGSYKRIGPEATELIGHRIWSARDLRACNYISTMAMIRRETFPGFDETIPRLQDWDLWLTMLEQGHRGTHCGSVTFSTEVREGISFGGSVDWNTARDIVAGKHGL